MLDRSYREAMIVIITLHSSKINTKVCLATLKFEGVTLKEVFTYCGIDIIHWLFDKKKINKLSIIVILTKKQTYLHTACNK